MMSLRQLEEDILATGKIDSHQLEALRQRVYAGANVDRRKADFLVELHKRLDYPNRGFEQFFYHAIKDHVLATGRIGAAESLWLKEMLFADGRLDDRERKFLHELKGETRETSPEFDQLYREAMKQPQEQHACG
jgi:hypothetical protein